MDNMDSFFLFFFLFYFHVCTLYELGWIVSVFFFFSLSWVVFDLAGCISMRRGDLGERLQTRLLVDTTDMYGIRTMNISAQLQWIFSYGSFSVDTK